MTDASDRRDRPNRVPWPPLIMVAAGLLALGLEALVPTAASGWLAAAGWVALTAGLGFDVWAMGTMMRARTTILPHRAADRLVTAGPFALTRNPIYLGNTLLLSGLGLAFGVLWTVPAALVAAVATERLAIRREEAHLALRFGPDFTAYAARVPRWLGPIGR